MQQRVKIWIAVALGLILVFLVGLGIEGYRLMMQDQGDARVVATTLPDVAISKPQISSEMEIPVEARRAAAEMHQIIIACRDYAPKHRGDWPFRLGDLQPYLNSKSINFDDYIYCFFGRADFGKVAVIVERNPVKGGGELIGFADGHVEWEKTFDWHQRMRQSDSEVVLSPVYDFDWPDRGGIRVGIQFTFNDTLDLPDSPRVIVGADVLMAGNCFQSAEVVANPDGTAGIRVIPSANMRDLLHGHTTRNMNHRLAIVLLEHGEPHLLGAPLIRAPMDDALLLPGPFKAEVAADLVSRINIVLKEQWAKYGRPNL